MTTVRELHNRAMELAQKAIILRELGDEAKSRELAYQACSFEEQAANMVPFAPESEPTRSILYKSAASLAYQAKDFDKAHRLIIQGLSGYPPYQIEDELNRLFDRVRFERDLEKRESLVGTNGIEITLRGNSIGDGVVPYSELIRRTGNMAKIVDRTTARLLDIPYAPNIRKSAKLFEPLIEAPKAGSFIIGIKIEYMPAKQQQLFISPEIIINEIMIGIEYVNNNDELSLREQMKSDGYYNHFLSMTKGMAPDGEKVNFVAFANRAKVIRLTRKENEIQIISSAEFDKSEEKQPEIITVQGVLDYANSQKNRSEMGLTTEKGEVYTIDVETGLEDYVRDNYKEYIRVQVLETPGEKRVKFLAFVDDEE